MRLYLCVAGLLTVITPLLPALGTVRQPVLAPSRLELQEKIDACARNGGGDVIVSAGMWESRPLVLKDGVTLCLAEGATLLASTNAADYGDVAGARVFIYAENARNVAIEGMGTIDGRGAGFRETTRKLDDAAQPQLLPVLLRFSRCRNVRLEGFTFRDAAAWGCHLRNCDGVTVRRVRAFSHVNGTNDGIDIESRNVLVEDCDIDTDDDAIVFKSESDPAFPVENVIVRNCRVASCCNGIKFGTGSYGDFRNVTVSNCVLHRAQGNFRFHWNRDAAKNRRIPGACEEISGLSALALEVVDGGRMENVHVRDIEIQDGFNVGLFVRQGRRHVHRDGRTSFFRNVLVENVKGCVESRIANSLTGVPGLPLRDMTLRNISLQMPGGGTAEAAQASVPEKENGYPECLMFDYGMLPAWGFYVRHAEDVRFENVRVSVRDADARPAFVADDARVAGAPEVCGRTVRSLDGPCWTLDGQPVSVPHTWNATDAADGLGLTNENSAAAVSYARRRGVYARLLPPVTPGKRVFLRCQGASMNAAVRLNGRPVGEHEGAYTAFVFELTPFLKPDDNRLEIAVGNLCDAAKTTPPISADYSIYGGLYRSVELIETDAVCIGLQDGAGIRVKADPATGRVDVSVRTDGASVRARLTYEIRERNGRLVARSSENALTVPNPRLWTPETPNLYTLTAYLEDGLSRDSVSVDFGFRTVECRADGFYLNGVRRQLRGVNIHQDREGRGWALAPSDIEEDVAWIKKMGADAVRTAHYPHAERFYSLCDRVGLLAWVEYPNVDAVNDSPVYCRRAETGLREMVGQLQNHPCIFLWSVANEIDAPFMGKIGLGGVSARAVADGFVRAVRSVDATRPVALVTCDRKPAEVNGAAEALGANLYPGWYALEADEMTRDLETVLASNPERCGVFVTEYGAGGSIFDHGDPLRRCQPSGAFHSEEYQAFVHWRNYRALVGDSRVFGTFSWLMFDFGADARREGPRHGINDKGLVTFDHKTAKDAFYFYKANWNSEPALHLVGSRMRTHASGPATVMGFSNLGETVLKVNGREIGRQMPDAVKTVCWNAVPLDVGANVIELASGDRSVRATWTVATGKETGK